MNASAEGPATVSVVDRQTLLPIDERAVQSLVTFALEAEDARGSVEVAFVDDATIADLHERFMQIPGPTDVITFPLADDDPPETGEAGESGLGEIVVSTETAQRQGPEWGLEPLDEAYLYVVHGVLHLLGYDDLEEGEAEAMATRQREIFDAWRDAADSAGESGGK